MFGSDDADFATAQALYRRCAYEALLALRTNSPAEEISKWVALASAVAELWENSDMIVVD